MVIDYADIRDLRSILEANEGKDTFIKCDQELAEKLSRYFDQQIEYQRLLEQKLGVKDQKLIRECKNKMSILSKQMMKDAKFIVNHTKIKEYSQSHFHDRVSLYDRGGADKIKERLQSQELSPQDMIAIAQDVSVQSKNLGRAHEQNLELERSVK